MAGIALLLPKESLTHLAQKGIEEEGYDVKEVKFILTANAIGEARRAVAEGASIIIARGYQASLIEQYTNVPIVKLKMTGQDLGILVKKAKEIVNKTCPKIGLVGIQNMFANIDYFNDIFQVQLMCYFGNKTENLQNAAEKAVTDGVDIIIGGDIAVLVAEQANVPHLFLECTFDSIREAIRTAETAIYAAEIEKKHMAQIGAFLENTFNGIIRLNTAGYILCMNRVMEDILQKKEADVYLKPLHEVITDVDEKQITSVLCGESDLYSSFIRIKENAVVFILTAVKVDEVIDSAILSCNIIRKKVKLEADAMKEMYLHGFVAKKNFTSLKFKDKNMQECVELAKIYSLSTSPVLIKGEIGCEKNELAECIHNHGLRKNSPYVVVNCSNMSEKQQEKLLFGEENSVKESDSLGMFGAANTGTVVIEEIENLGKQLQYKIFQVITNSILIKMDAQQVASLDVRIIATTNIDLFKKMQTGDFREDLYYALRGLQLEVPSLRERPLDLEMIIMRTMKDKLSAYSRYHVLSQGAKEVLLAYYWSGNRLQLESFLDRMILSAKKRNIEEEYVNKMLVDLYPVIHKKNGENQIVIYKDPKAEELASILEQYHGDRTLAAKELGISKTTLWRHMKKYGISGRFKA
ncbi:sigma 54-interacting transcriptional regulator [Lachnotalea glycerini]|uniref:Sigma-54 factor interaction domain-containing protein n=1 Tax=Lachnotalea glycerini TaxID=1763509 RepID=A0A371JGQ0_9FIRM|nr:sigma 54-interacting transcriptional regulator [Lachnotalea glycerini]RDY31857.1 hypothetical protein CG710_007690 [Lachnotalea glycerini]